MRALYSMTNQIRQIIHRSKLKILFIKSKAFHMNPFVKELLKSIFTINVLHTIASRMFLLRKPFRWPYGKRLLLRLKKLR